MTLAAHLATGATTVCRAWAITRSDGVTLGFTDHDRDLAFEDVLFRADSGLTARALEQVTGLAVDNSEAVGALRDAGLQEADIMAGRYDGAALRIWEVNWADITQRTMLFLGSLGEITRADGAFRAELRGLSEALDAQAGRLYHAQCSAILGDAACRFDLSAPGFALQTVLEQVEAGQHFTLAALEMDAAGWFAHGRLVVLDGAAAGLMGHIREDRATLSGRRISLWEGLRAPVAAGDLVRLEAGCDKQAETCRTKFANLLNFQGFPHIPGEDWQSAYPRAGQPNDGGARRR
ncbi:MAG: DUF2163 domain-containing protein [Roseinatronobacter sp.]